MKPVHLASIVFLAALGTACAEPVAPDTRHEALASSAVVVPQGSPHTAASGLFAQTGITSLDVRAAGPNTIIEQTAMGSLTGTLTGSFEDQLRVVIHPNGRFTTKFTIRCTCTVAGNTGVLDIQAEDDGELVSPTLARFAGRAVITGGSGDLSGLRGLLDIEGTVDVATGLATYAYSGRIRFLP
jgi:hypothetical protein